MAPGAATATVPATEPAPSRAAKAALQSLEGVEALVEAANAEASRTLGSLRGARVGLATRLRAVEERSAASEKQAKADAAGRAAAERRNEVLREALERALGCAQTTNKENEGAEMALKEVADVLEKTLAVDDKAAKKVAAK